MEMKAANQIGRTRVGRWLLGSVLVLGVAGGFALSCSRTLGGGDFEAEARAACGANCSHRQECDPDDPWQGTPPSVVWKSHGDCTESCLTYKPLHTDDPCGWAVVKNKRCLAEVPCKEYWPWVLPNEPGVTPDKTDPCPETNREMAEACGW